MQTHRDDFIEPICINSAMLDVGGSVNRSKNGQMIDSVPIENRSAVNKN